MTDGPTKTKNKKRLLIDTLSKTQKLTCISSLHKIHRRLFRTLSVDGNVVSKRIVILMNAMSHVLLACLDSLTQLKQKKKKKTLSRD